LEIVDIREAPDCIDLLASWHYQEWSSLYPDETEEDFAAELRKCLQQAAVPTTFIALVQGEPVGSISLLARDMDIDEPWGPWLANFYVRPGYRRGGIGRKLIEQLLAHGRRNGIEGLCLFTPHTRKYYERLGWQTVRTTEYQGEIVDIMYRAL